jgi:putative ABC transport system permease protein
MAFTQDLRFGVRLLRRNPGFTLLSALVLALGIGSTVAMFTAVDAILLRPLPHPSPDRLVRLWGQNLARSIPFHNVPYADVAVWRREATTFEALSAWTTSPGSLAVRGGEAEFVTVARVNAEFFPVLGVTLAAGRPFAPSDDQPGARQVAVVTQDVWERRLGAPEAIDGVTITLDGSVREVVGVLPRGFWLAGTPDAAVYVPLADAGARQPQSQSVSVFGRLRTGTSRAQAQAEMDALSRSLDEQVPQRFPRSVRVWGLREFVARDVRVSLLVLLGAVAIVLLIACVNVATLLLARGTARRRESSVRLALGATRGRLVSQMLTESTLLASLGGAGGVGFAYWALALVKQLDPAAMPMLAHTSIDGRVLAFAVGISALAGLVAGVSPALSLARTSAATTLHAVLRDQSRRTRGSLRGGLRTALVALEVALSIILLVGAGLLLRSYARLARVDPGFRPSGVITATLSLRAERYADPAARRALQRRLLEELQATPGVAAAALTTLLPLSGANQGTIAVGLRGAITRPEDAQIVWFRFVSADYFRTLGIPLRRGRAFDASDDGDARTAIVSEAMARRFWPGEDPIGQQFGPPGSTGPLSVVVGVVGEVRHMGLLDAPEPEVYWPIARNPAPGFAVAVRTMTNPDAFAPTLAALVGRLDPQQAVSDVLTMKRAVAGSVSAQRLSMTLLALFALLAIALASAGLYGVLSHLVQQRTHEIGVRMALGAAPGDVRRLVLRDGMGAALVGTAVGLGGALVLARVMRTMVFGISTYDAISFAAAPVLLLMVAMAAAWIPARRATAIDPVIALREG